MGQEETSCANLQHASQKASEKSRAGASRCGSEAVASHMRQLAESELEAAQRSKEGSPRVQRRSACRCPRPHNRDGSRRRQHGPCSAGTIQGYVWWKASRGLGHDGTCSRRGCKRHKNSAEAVHLSFSVWCQWAGGNMAFPIAG